MNSQNTNIKRHDLYKQIIADLKAGQFERVEHWCMNHLRRHRTTAQLWVFLGEALFQQGYYVEAERVFNRALLLDPQASWQGTIFTKIREKLGDEPTPCREDIQRLLQVESVSVSAALIVKDEERSIVRCIESIVDAVDEIIVLDTGSTDRTLQLLQRYPQVKVYHAAWQNDFAAARNKAMEYVTSQWVMWIDADEHLHPEDVRAIKEAAGLLNDFPEPAAYIVGKMNRYPGKHSANAPLAGASVAQDYEVDDAKVGDSQNHYLGAQYSEVRLFAMRHGLRFWGKVHEQVGAKEGLHETKLYGQALRIRLFHDGYEPSIIASKNKLHRNITLLKEMVKEEPHNPAVWANLGREIMLTGDFDSALRILLHAEQAALQDEQFARIADIHMHLVRVYIAKRDFASAELVCRRAIAATPGFPDSYYWLARIQMHWAKVGSASTEGSVSVPSSASSKSPESSDSSESSERS